VQPSEIGKLIVILVLAKYFSDNKDHIKELRVFATSLVIAAVPALLVFAEPDLGSATIFLLIWLGMCATSWARWAWSWRYSRSP
jgi:rod shape determining protein RodA